MKNLFYDLDKYITGDRFIGQGASNKVYAIDENFVLRVDIDLDIDAVASAELHDVDDVFQGKNFGQAVAKSQDDKVSINKRVSGKPLYLGIDIEENDDFSVENYLSTLETCLNFNENLIINFINDVLFINSKKYYIDITNSENFLYDVQNNRLNLIDLAYSPDWSQEINSNCILFPFIGNEADICAIYNISDVSQRKKMFELFSLLSDRIFKYCLEFNIPLISWTEKSKFTSFETILAVANDIDFENDNLFEQVINLKYNDVKFRFYNAFGEYSLE